MNGCGERFGDYELLEAVGRGGMGVVYRARHISLHRIVALKMVAPGRLSDEENIKRFHNEALAAANLQHPNIVAIHEVGEIKGQHYYSMDFVPGKNLAELTHEHPLAHRKAAQYVQKLALAIHYAHGQGVLHRDLKPSNVLIDQNDEPRVADFGLAKLMQQDSELTHSGMIMGSPSYMPPEQASGRLREVGVHSDVYALGAVLYDLLCGRPPFRAHTAMETLRQVQEVEPVSPRLLNPRVPRDLETICIKCLQKESARRYASANDLAAELGRFLRNEPIRARPLSWVEKSWRWCRRNPRVALAFGTAFVVFQLGFGISLWQWLRAEAKALSAQQHLYAADMNLVQQALEQNNYGYARRKLQAHRPPPGQRDLRGWEWRYLWMQCQGDELCTLQEQGEAVNCLTFSPNAALLVSASKDGIRIWHTAQHQLVTHLPPGGSGAFRTSVAFSPDQSSLTILRDHRIQVFSTETWVPTREFFPRSSETFHSLLFLTDRLLASSSDQGLRIWDVVTGADSPAPLAATQACQQLVCSADGRWLAVSLTAGKVLVWDRRENVEALRWDAGRKKVSAIALSSQGVLAAGDRDGKVHLWNLSLGKETSVWQANRSTIFDLAFSPDETVLASAGSDQVIHLWGWTNVQKLTTLKGHSSEIWDLAFSRDGTVLASGGKDGVVKLWDPAYHAPTNTLPGSYFPLWFSPDGKALVTFNLNHELQFWDVKTKTKTSVFPPPSNNINFQEISPDGHYMVFRHSDNSLHFYELATRKPINTLFAGETNLVRVSMYVFSPDSSLMAVSVIRAIDGRDTRRIELFNTANQQPLAVLENTYGLGWGIMFSPNNQYLAARNDASQLVIWDVRKRQIFRQLEGHYDLLTSLAFSPDGKFLAAGSGDGVARVWDLKTGDMLHTLSGHYEGVGKIVFTPDSRTLISGSTDDTIKFWHAATGQELLTLTDFGEDTWELLLSPDGSTLAAGRALPEGKTPVTLWHVPSLAEIDAAQGWKLTR